MVNYVLLEGRGKGQEEYADMLVSLHRLSATSQVKKTAKALGFEVRNTATEKDGTKYIGEINHNQANSLVVALGGGVIRASQGLDLLDDLTKDKPLYDETGKKLSRAVARNLYEEIIQKRDPWRGEHLADRCFALNENLLIATSYVLQNGVLVPEHLSLLTAGQIEKQEKRAKKHDLYFVSPNPDTVARFNANSDWAGLNCGWDPIVRGAGLGLRFACEK